IIVERTRILLPATTVSSSAIDQAILPSCVPRCRTAIMPVALLRPDPVHGRSLAEDRVEMDRVQLVRTFDNTISFLISEVKNDRKGLETALATGLVMVSQSNSSTATHVAGREFPGGPFSHVLGWTDRQRAPDVRVGCPAPLPVLQVC